MPILRVPKAIVREIVGAYGKIDIITANTAGQFILVSLQKKSTFEAAARTAAVSATRWKARVYAICGKAAAHSISVLTLKHSAF